MTPSELQDKLAGIPWLTTSKLLSQYQMLILQKTKLLVDNSISPYQRDELLAKFNYEIDRRIPND